MKISMRMRVEICALAAASACAAPGDSEQAREPVASQRETVALDRRGPFTIHGTATLHGVTSTGIESNPIDLSAAPFAVYSLSHGELVREVGVGLADGTFTVPVTTGARTWELETNLFGTPNLAVGDAREPDLDRTVLGRLDATQPTAETDVSISATGLAAWQFADTTQIMSANNGAVVFSPEFQFATPPAIGDTAITAQTIDWAAQGVPLVEAAKGDTVVMSQLVTRTSGTEVYNAVARIGAADGFTQRDGVAATLNVVMSPVPQKSLALHWEGPRFEALRAEAGASAVDLAGAPLFFIDALPDAERFGFYANAPDLMGYFPSDSTANLAVTVEYGNPYSTRGRPWDEFAIINYPFAVPVQLGAAAPRNEFAGYHANLSLSQLCDGIIAPLISPVRNVRIAGRDLGVAQSGVGPSPTVRWDAPRLGRATQYFVSLKQLTEVSARTVSTVVASFVTRDRSLQIPSTFLVPGGTYLLSMTAVNFGTVDRTTSLFGDGLPFASARSITATFTP